MSADDLLESRNREFWMARAPIYSAEKNRDEEREQKAQERRAKR